MKTTDGGKLVLGLTVLLLTVGAGVAWGDEAGSASATFLKISPNGQPAAMGGAYSALATDVNALYYNPGGLGFVRQGEIALMHNEYLGDVNHEYLAFVYPGFHGGTIGMDATYLDLGSFQRTTVAATGEPILGGNFSASDLALKVGYGSVYSPEISWGISAKYIREQLDNVEAQGWAADLGLMYRPATNPNLSFGMALLNLGPKMGYQNRHERLPLLWRFGAGYQFDQFPITLGAEVKKPIDNDWGFALGGEYLFNRTLAIRLGYDSLMDAGSGFTCGAGFKMDAFSIDYAYEPTDHLGDIHRLSLNLNFGKPVEPTPPAPAYHPQYGTAPSRLPAQPQYYQPYQPAPPPAYQPPPAAPKDQVNYEYSAPAAPIYVAPPPSQPQYY